MYCLWDISLYSFSYGHHPELREKCQFKRQVTQFIFEIMSKTTSSSKKRKYTIADAIDYVSSVLQQFKRDFITLLLDLTNNLPLLPNYN